MNRILILLLILIVVDCKPDDDKRERIERMRERRKQEDKEIAECILKNDKASDELKKNVEKYKDDHVKRAFHPRDHKYDDNDQKIIRECRRASMDKMREEFKKERDLERKRREKEKHINSDNL